MAAASSTLPDEPLAEARIPGDKHQLVKDTFTAFDKDGSGKIAEWELREVFKTLGEDMTDEACRVLIKEVDADNDGEINFPEFCKVSANPCSMQI
jgi:calmodulin